MLRLDAGTARIRDTLTLDLGDGKEVRACDVGNGKALQFPLRQSITMRAPREELRKGKHQIKLDFETKPDELQWPLGGRTWMSSSNRVG